MPGTYSSVTKQSKNDSFYKIISLRGTSGMSAYYCIKWVITGNE